MAAILLEISYTRIFSFKIWHYFTYLIIGVALLGLGPGGVAVAVSRRLREADPARLISGLCIAGCASVLAGYFIIALTQLNMPQITTDPAEIFKLLGVCMALVVPFVAVGIIISTILGNRPEAAGRLYCVDLIGAAIGCAICIPVLVLIGPPKAIMLAGLILAIAGCRSGARSPVLLGVGSLAGLLILLPLIFGRLLPDPVVDKSKAHWGYKNADLIRLSKWHPVFRVDVTESLLKPGKAYDLLHDGLLGSHMILFDGDLSQLDYLRKDSRALPFEVLADGPKVLIIGSAGGHEILASLYFGASHVTAIELNPVTVSLLTDTYADVTGRLHEHPRVTLINGEGRWFMKQSEEKYDLIWFVAPDSYAAMNASSSGAYVLAESYLYTVEMLRQSLEHLTENGVICAQFGEPDFNRKPNHTTRYVSTARRAFSEYGLEEFDRHVAVSTADEYPPLSLSTVLLGKSPLTPEQGLFYYRKALQLNGGEVRYLPGQRVHDSPVGEVITRPWAELGEWFDEHPYQVGPVWDNSPYFWHFARFKDALATLLGLASDVPDYRFLIGELVSIILLFIAILFAAVFLLLPLVSIRNTWAEMPYKWSAGVYFAALGLGFMFHEVSLIQMFTLFLGYPTHSLTVTLFSMLLFSGLGSLLSERYGTNPARSLRLLLAGLIGLAVFYQLALPMIIAIFAGQSFGLRVLVTIAVMAPLGLCLGAFMPIGLTTVARLTSHKREYVAWAWAVNGFFSVMASILSTILAMVFGFRIVLLIALAVYAVGVFSLVGLMRHADQTPEESIASARVSGQN